MRKLLGIVFMSLAACLMGQGPVDLCLIVNGQINPASKTMTVCDPASPDDPPFSVISNNCSTTPGNSAYIRYDAVFNPQTTNATIYNNSSTGNFSDTRSGWYKVRIKYNDGITVVADSDSVNISFHPWPPLIFTTNNTTQIYTKCPNNILTLNLNNSGLTNYRWFRQSTSTILSTTPSLTLDITNSFSSKYIVEARDNNGCLTDSSFNVFITQAPLVNLGAATITRCSNGTSTITINNSLHSSNSIVPNYLWKGGSSLSSLVNITPNTSTNNFSISFKSAPGGTPPPYEFSLPSSDYYVVVELTPTIFNPAAICTSYDTVFIDVIPPPVPVCSNDTLICNGATASLRSTMTGGLPPYVYTWDNGAGSAATASVSPTSTTTYTLSVTDGSGCGFAAQTDNVTVTVNPPISANAGADQIICIEPAGVANLNGSGTGGTGAFTYSWTPTDGLSSITINNPVANPSTTTTYTFTVKDVNNCSATDNVVITRYEPEIGPIPFPVVVSEGRPVIIDISTPQNSGKNFTWTNLNSSTVISTGPSYEAKFFGEDTTFYEIKVVDPNNNCIARDTSIIYYISDNIIMYVPNIFSPSASLEANRKLKIFGDNISDDGFRFAIFNKWGQTVWETNSVEEAREGWDGGPQIEGVYTYIVEGKFKNDKPITESKDYMGTFKLSK
ncbi:MAG: gliding motility-associated C-terminal domain-containing protein [Cytophagaceae bacterium]|jgi:hypothetical protein|nr:gliding motility-associated C-terminal domain-containing protein [Cytophagaceae bacterium]